MTMFPKPQQTAFLRTPIIWQIRQLKKPYPLLFLLFYFSVSLLHHLSVSVWLSFSVFCHIFSSASLWLSFIYSLAVWSTAVGEVGSLGEARLRPVSLFHSPQTGFGCNPTPNPQKHKTSGSFQALKEIYFDDQPSDGVPLQAPLS